MEMGVHVHAVVRCGCMSCVNARYLSGRLPTPPAAGAAGAGRVALTGRCRPAHAEQQRDAENTVRSGMRTTNPSFFLYFAQTSVVRVDSRVEQSSDRHADGAAGRREHATRV